MKRVQRHPVIDLATPRKPKNGEEPAGMDRRSFLGAAATIAAVTAMPSEAPARNFGPATAMQQLVFVGSPDNIGAVQAAGFDGYILGDQAVWFDGRTMPYIDEPEDWSNARAFSDWLASHPGPLVTHWNVPKAKKNGVWQPKSYASLGCNWYPQCSAIPASVRGYYVPFLCLQYRQQWQQPNLPVFGTLGVFDGTDEDGTKYWVPSDAWMRYNQWCWKFFLGDLFAGFLWFYWGQPGGNDGLVNHPEWWPIKPGG